MDGERRIRGTPKRTWSEVVKRDKVVASLT